MNKRQKEEKEGGKRGKERREIETKTLSGREKLRNGKIK